MMNNLCTIPEAGDSDEHLCAHVLRLCSFPSVLESLRSNARGPAHHLVDTLFGEAPLGQTHPQTDLGEQGDSEVRWFHCRITGRSHCIRIVH